MSQYGNSSKNPPWARSGQNVSQQNAVPQPLMAGAGMMQYPQVFQGQQAMGMSMPGMPQGPVNPMQAAMQASNHQMYGTVSYPTRALNTAAFQSPQQQISGSQSGKQNRVFTGTVTKVQDNFGIVDEEVFFQSSCCVKGSTPQVGDRVLVEAVYNANMPYKWNATRIQVLSLQEGGGQRSGGQSYGGGRSHQPNYNSVPPPRHSGSPAPNRFSSGGGSRFSNSSNDRGNRGTGAGMGRDSRRDEPENRKRRRDDRDKDEKVKSPPRKRSRSPVKPARRPRRPPPRYNVSVPRTSLNGRDGDVVEIKKRYTNMYIPSDFFLSEYRWTDTFPIGKPISLDFPCAFHIFHKDVDPLEENDAVLEPSDADYIYSAKVMLLASPGLEELYKKCTISTEERENSKSTVDEDSLSHPSRMIQFLVGTRGKENMAIGGPWSPSEDGEDPSGDPSVLVRTAIRTTKALTGIDLSGCTQWFRFVEVHYYRSETAYRGKSYPARVETVVIFVPDVWSCVPTRLEWDELQLSYQKALAAKLNDEDNDQKEDDEETPEKESPESQTSDKVKGDPKHYSELDPKSMKVNELREELEARNLSPKGLKSQLAARLSKALKTEEEEEQSKKSGAEESAAAKKKEEPVEKEKKETEEKKKKEDDEKKKIDERERQQWEKRYKLPKKPHLCVHPSRTAKSGKFDCSVQSLTSLLGYRQDDTKEHSFEVSIFAELFNEMLMRDFGFNIYRAIAEAPEKPKEEKEKEKSKDEKEKSKDDKEKDKPKEEKGKDDDKDKDQKKESKSKEKDDKDSEQRSEDMDAQSDGEDTNEDGKEQSLKDENVSKDNDSKDKKGDKETRKERAKMITYDKLLLLSFTFFDISRCGYIYDKDIEDLLFSLGLTLSRSQVRKLLGKVVSRDAVYYRRLTDKPEGSPPVEHLSLDLLVGNKLILPSFLANQKESIVKQSGEASEVQKGQLITYNGTIIDISKVMDQLTRSETTRHETERALGKLRDDFSKLKETATKSEKHIKELRDDLRDYRERLSVSNSELSSLQAKEKHFVRTLTEISDKIKPLIAKQEPKQTPPEPPKAKEVIVDLVDEKGEEPMAVDEDK